MHEVEQMFSVREKPWHYEMTKDVTKLIQEAPTSAEALRLAGLDWTIEGKPVYDGKFNEIHGFKANTRSSDGRVLGIVSDKYKVVQNTDAFDFTDALISNGMTYETAGSLRGGRTIWLLGKLPERKIVGDDFEPYICFTNSHDGTGAVRCAMTPIRVVCANTLNLAMRRASRTWSTVHRGNIIQKLEEARETLELANKYLVALDETADKLANESFTEGQMHDTLNKMFPLEEDATERQKKTVEAAKDQIIICTLRPDVAKFLNTKWGFINAVSDYVGHADPARKTRNWQENRWGNIIGGHNLLDEAMALVSK